MSDPAELLGGLQAIAHARRVRLHTRLPIVLPCHLVPRLVRENPCAAAESVLPPASR